MTPSLFCWLLRIKLFVHQILVDCIGSFSAGTHGKDNRCRTGNNITTRPDRRFTGRAVFSTGNNILTYTVKI
jgi:hypothetical protein